MFRCFRSEADSYPDISPQGDIRRVVTLVHGTWARGFFNLRSRIGWYEPDGPLCAALWDGPEGHTLIHRFTWSGQNRVSAREDAIRKLQGELTELVNKHDNAAHFVLGHSHGGNIILSALRDSFLAERVAGVACLSTPFVRVALRPWVKPNLEDGYETMSRIIFATPLFLTVMALAWFVFAMPSDGALPSSFPVAGMVMIAAIFCTVLVLFKKSVSMSIWRRLYRSASSSAKALQQRDTTGVRLLVVRAVADEASTTLVLSQFVAWLAGNFDNLLVRLFGVGFSITIVASTGIAFRTGNLQSPAVGDAFVLFVGVLVALLLMSFALRALTAVPFGIVTIATPLLDISAEAAPTGHCTILQLPTLHRGRMNHGVPHADVQVATIVAEWLFTNKIQSLESLTRVSGRPTSRYL